MTVLAAILVWPAYTWRNLESRENSDRDDALTLVSKTLSDSKRSSDPSSSIVASDIAVCAKRNWRSFFMAARTGADRSVIEVPERRFHYRQIWHQATMR